MTRYNNPSVRSGYEQAGYYFCVLTDTQLLLQQFNYRGSMQTGGIVIKLEIIRRLESLGFTTYEAKAYYALLQKYPANGYEVSKISQIPPSKIYETLQKLKTRGAVMDSQTDTTLYLPVEPSVFFSHIKAETVKTVDTVISDLASVRPFDTFDLTWNLNGAHNIHEKTNAIIDRAKTDVYLSIWPEQAGVIRQSVAQAMARGVRIIAATFGACPIPADRVVNLESCAANISLRASARLSTVVCDNQEMVIGEFIDNQEAAKGVWTKTPAIVLVAKEYIKHDIMAALLAEHMGEAAYRSFCQSNALIGEMRGRR